jgi:hypothetical protein
LFPQGAIESFVAGISAEESRWCVPVDAFSGSLYIGLQSLGLLAV